MVESALVTLVVAAALIGIFDLGQVLFVHQTFVARVRLAARYGQINTSDVNAIKNMVLYGQPGAGTFAVFGLTADKISVTMLDTGLSEQRIVVAISGYPYRLFSPWIGGVFTGRPIVASMPLETP